MLSESSHPADPNGQSAQDRYRTSWRQAPQISQALRLLVLVGLFSVAGCAGTGTTTDQSAASSSADEISPTLRKELETFDAAFEWQRASTVTTPQDYEFQSLFREVFRQARTIYVKEADDHALIAAAIAGLRRRPLGSSSEDLIGAAMKAMLNSLDKYSDYIAPAQWVHIYRPSNPPWGAIGIGGEFSQGGLLITEVFDSSPAALAGLRIGDRLIEINEKTLHGLDLGEVMERLRGPLGSSVQVMVARQDASPFLVQLKRAVITPVMTKSHNHVVYIRLGEVTERTEARLRQRIVELIAAAEHRPLSYILDLRDNPGGLLDQCVAVAGDFLEGSVVVSVEPRREAARHDLKAQGKDLTDGAPLIVLTNGRTASGAEIIAAALRDNRRAKLVGTPTAGNGSVQTTTPLGAFGAMRLTTAYLRTSAGRLIPEGGLMPDVFVSAANSAPGDVREDAQYVHAAHMLRELNDSRRLRSSTQ